MKAQLEQVKAELGLSRIFNAASSFIIGSKNIITNIYRIQSYDLIMCGYFCIGFIDLMLKGKCLLHYANLFSPNECEKNDKVRLNYFQ